MDTTFTLLSTIIDLAICTYLFYNIGGLADTRFNRTEFTNAKYSLTISLVVNFYLIFVLIFNTEFFVSLGIGYFIGGYLSQVTTPKTKLLGYKYQQMNHIIHFVIVEVYVRLYQFINKRK